MTEIPSAIPVPPSPQEPALAKIKLDAEGRIDEDVTCRRCGYNLRSLSPDGRCPECATAVGRSLQGDFLRFCDPDWVTKLASGMNWIVAGLIIGFIGGVMMSVGFAFAAGIGGGLTTSVAGVASIALAIIPLIGYWKITAPEPTGFATETGFNVRKLVRVTQVGTFATKPLGAFLPIATPVLRSVFNTLSPIISVIGFLAVFIYARRLALRIPNERLARHCRIVMWGLTSLTILILGAGFVVPMLLSRTMAITTTTPAGLAAMGYITTPPAATTTTSAPAALAATGNVTTAPATPLTPAETARLVALGYLTTAPAVTTSGPAVTITPVGGAGATVIPTGSFLGSGALVGTCVAGSGMLVFGIWSLVLIVWFRRQMLDAAKHARATWATNAPPGSD